MITQKQAEEAKRNARKAGRRLDLDLRKKDVLEVRAALLGPDRVVDSTHKLAARLLCAPDLYLYMESTVYRANRGPVDCDVSLDVSFSGLVSN